MSSQEHISIDAKASEIKSENFDFLREEGIRYLQKIAGKIWTDYNIHDPGVTILEQLCYAITDLGYRTNLDIQDILAIDQANDQTKDLNNFFTAREIMTNGPWTVNDFRKLVIDVKGIKNAWFDRSTEAEVDFFADYAKKQLSYDNSSDAKEVLLNGLYAILIELDESDEFGDLNDNTINTTLTFSRGQLAGLILDITAEFPYWSYEWPAGKGWNSLLDVKQSIRKITIKIKEEAPELEVQIKVNGDNSIDVEIADITTAPFTAKPALATKVKNEILKQFEVSKPSNTLLVRQQLKVKETRGIVQQAKNTVHNNRNLCEDFVQFNALKIEEILICADIEVTAEADAEEVLAEIYFLIGKFLAPDIQFYSIEELLELGKTMEQIFEGPRLNNGFINEDELTSSSRRKSIHVSDLINIIMDIPGVIAIKSIEIGNIPLGDSSIPSRSAKWCLDLAWEKNFVPRLTVEKSKITFIKKNIPFIADASEVDELLALKKENQKKENEIIPPLDLPIPNGDFYKLDDYTSIQNDFPDNYGISAVGLPKNASSLRKSQAKQLKGFLLIFDQILANYCSQLGSVKELFSMNSDINATHFHQSLFDIPGAKDLYADFTAYGSLNTNPEHDEKVHVKTSWEEFKLNDTDADSFDCEKPNKSHKESLTCIIEDREKFYKRRNAFLDHLLARFSEQFTDYAMLVFKLDRKKYSEELIDDKLQFLQEYPTISYERGKAFNYKLPSWGTKNVSGLEKRVSRLLGIADYTRDGFICPKPAAFFKKEKKDNGKHYFRFVNTDDEVLLRSQSYSSSGGRNNGIKSVTKNGVNFNNYASYENEITVDGKKQKIYFYQLEARNGEPIASSLNFKTAQERDQALLMTIAQFNGDCMGEGFHLIEHILLRPRTNEDDFLPVSFEDDCYCEGSEDAYSFRATCILPYWIGRFNNMDFRLFAERTIREEAPAHIFMKICWIGKPQMEEFEIAYKKWLKELENSPINQPELTKAQNSLIGILDKVRNVYPVSNLYDCQETDNSPVRLGQSILGTFIPKENE